MPHFFAPHSSSTNIAGKLYALEVIPPQRNAAYRVTAYVSDNLQLSVVSRALASEYGVRSEGESLWIEIEQFDHLTLSLHTFDPIPVKIARFAHPRLGNTYLQLGMNDLQRFFDLFEVVPPQDSPSPDMLLLQPLQPYKHWCHKSIPGGSP